MNVVIYETRTATWPTCPHTTHIPCYNEEACLWLSQEQVREKYPRYVGPCQACGLTITAYANVQHLKRLGY